MISLEEIFSTSVNDSNEQCVQFPIEKIIITPQVRRNKNQDKIKEIAASIKTNGQYQPIVLDYPNDDGFCELLVGFTRYHAQVFNGASHIMAIHREKPERIRVMQLVENIHREDLSIEDLALAIFKLKNEDGLSPKEIGEELVMKSPKVSKFLGIGAMPEEFLARIAALTKDIDTFYLLSTIYKKKPELAESLVADGEQNKELDRVTVRSAADSLKNTKSVQDESKPPVKATGSAGNESGISPSGDSDNGSESDTGSFQGDKDTSLAGSLTVGGSEGETSASESQTSRKEPAPKKADDQPKSGKAVITVSFVDDGDTVEAILVTEHHEKPAKGNVFVMIINGDNAMDMPIEIPLEDLSLVQVKYR